jgi:hypothetical protein
MNSEVDFTLGFNCWIVATETPDFVAITPNVSPACTVQNRGPDEVVVVVLVDLPVVVGVETVLSCWVGMAEGAGECEPDWRPERMSTIAIVAARRNAAGAT